MILVTGGFGLIGSNIARRLLKDGNQVIVFDQFVDDRSLFFGDVGSVYFESGNIVNELTMAELFKKYSIQAVVHAAANTNGVYCTAHPAEAVQTNMMGTLHLLELCRIHDISKFVYISSGSVFGLQDTTDPIYESTPSTAMNTYATTKKLSEELLHCYKKGYGLDVTSVRISWVFGPTPTLRKPRWNQGPIGYYFWKVLTEGALVEESGIDFKANFTHVDDVSEGLVRILLTKDAPLYAHLSSEQLYSNHEIVDFIRNKSPESYIEVGEGVEPFVKQAPIRGPLVSEYKEVLDYAPSVNFSDALHAHYDWMAEEIKKTSGKL